MMSGVGLVGCTSGSVTSPDASVKSGAAAGSTVAAALVGPTWRLTALEGQAVLAGSKVTALFTSDARVSGSAGCNGYFGRAEAASGQLSVGPLGSTLMACANDVLSQETRYLAALQAASSYTRSGDELRLGRTGSDVSLVYTSR
jgi:putative lipoprotein